MLTHVRTASLVLALVFVASSSARAQEAVTTDQARTEAGVAELEQTPDPTEPRSPAEALRSGVALSDWLAPAPAPAVGHVEAETESVRVVTPALRAQARNRAGLPWIIAGSALIVGGALVDDDAGTVLMVGGVISAAYGLFIYF